MPSIWLQIIAQVGIPLAYQIWQIFQNKTEPTEEDWQKLLALGRKTEQQYVDEAKATLNPTPAPTPDPVSSVPVPPA